MNENYVFNYKEDEVMYFMDKRIWEVVEDLDTSFLAPELHYEIVEGTDENVIIEEWFCENGDTFEFKTEPNKEGVDLIREDAFNLLKNKPIYVKKLTIPSNIFRNMVLEIE